MKTKLITSEYLNYYKSKQPISILKHFNKIKETVLNAESFGYNIAKSSVYSSMIEGNPIDFDSYLRYTNSGFNTKSKSFKEIQDLIYAYDFASKNSLTKKNILLAHKILSDNLLEEEKYRGNIRDKDVFVYSREIQIYQGAKKRNIGQRNGFVLYGLKDSIIQRNDYERNFLLCCNGSFSFCKNSSICRWKRKNGKIVREMVFITKTR